MLKKLAVIAIGGNSLIKDTNKKSFEDQSIAAHETCNHIVDLILKDYNVVITHGNGPQVGFILRRAEIAKDKLPIIPLDACGANTQGEIGYNIQRALYNSFIIKNQNPLPIATMITQTVVNKDDTSFQTPSKPIGSFLDEKTALKRKKELGWDVVEDAGRGWRRVVASPLPIKIIELPAIKKLLEANMIVIAAGGGGIPVTENNSKIEGAEAVIDKDFATSLLARELLADKFIVSTSIDRVYINFNQENQKAIDKMRVSEAENYIKEGHFSPGSMLPKIKACLDFVKITGNKAIITSPENISKAIEGKAGTTIVP